MDFNSVEDVDKELNRLNNILKRGKIKGKIWTPNLAKIRIEQLLRLKIKLKYPLTYKFRLFIKDLLEKFYD